MFVVFSPRAKPFYVGVTFGGDTTVEAKLLIDKVKNYTNLFVLQSGALQRDANAINEIGDYATSMGLNFLVYSGVDKAYQTDDWIAWIEAAKQRWGSKFLGIYYGDEPGGKMLDTYLDLSVNGTHILKLSMGGIEIGSDVTVQIESNVTATGYSDIIYYADGTVRASYSIEDVSKNGILQIIDPYGKIIEEIPNMPRPENPITNYPNGTTAVWVPLSNTTIITYCPNGTITVQEHPANVLFTVENGSDRISQVESYSAILAKSPIKNCDEAAKIFVSNTHDTLEWLGNQSVTILTSDYALYWWDYLSGYDVVLAQLGWNNTVAQEIGLARGAANLQSKSWGAIITWKYTEWPYLASSDEIYSQMRTAYECGAEYVVVFNYAENMTGPYGILQPEHFQALECFWNEVVQNPGVVHGGVKADAALVLPNNYGWGMRRPDDTIWGLWSADITSQQIWAQLQSKLQQYGSRLDIVYDDPAYPATGRYRQVYYWNQTS
jgi:hypothetical protein